MSAPHALSTADVPIQFLKSVFLTGNIPFRALTTDPRVSYTLYIPPDHYNPDPKLQESTSDVKSLDPRYLLPKLPLIVTVHGTGRNAETCRNLLAPFADSERVAILAPLFPAALDGETDFDSYKLLRSKTLRSDKALLDMLKEVGQRWPGIDTEKIILMGFSGGGQFTHRFLYLYPEMLRAASVGAPGRITDLDPTKNWPDGIKNVPDLFGPERAIDLEKIRAIKDIQLIVGGDDSEIHGGKEFWTWLTKMKQATRKATNGEHDEGSHGDDPQNAEMRVNRLDALKALKASLEGKGIASRLDIVEGVRHDSRGVHATVQSFLRPVIRSLHRQ